MYHLFDTILIISLVNNIFIPGERFYFGVIPDLTLFEKHFYCRFGKIISLATKCKQLV